MNQNTPRITQVGLVVQDEESVKAQLKLLFGLTPSKERFIRGDETRRYYGAFEDFEAKLIYYQFGTIEIEYIVPLKGRNIWQDHLNEYGESLHHIQIAVDDSDEEMRRLNELGIPAIQEGATVSKIPGAKWKYFDTRDRLKFILEIFDGEAKSKTQA